MHVTVAHLAYERNVRISFTRAMNTFLPISETFCDY